MVALSAAGVYLKFCSYVSGMLRGCVPDPHAFQNSQVPILWHALGFCGAKPLSIALPIMRAYAAMACRCSST